MNNIETVSLRPEWGPPGWLALDEDGRLRDASPLTCDDLGYSREEMLKMNIRSIEPEFDLAGVRINQGASPGQSVYRTAVHRRKDGELLPVEMCLVPVQGLATGMWLAWIRRSTAKAGAAFSPEDVDAILKFSGDLAHRLNNLLTIVQVHASYLLAEKSLDADSNESVREIYAAVDRAAQLTGELGAIARGRSGATPESWD